MGAMAAGADFRRRRMIPVRDDIEDGMAPVGKRRVGRSFGKPDPVYLRSLDPTRAGAPSAAVVRLSAQSGASR
jgi:hypothetical protein